LENPRNKDRKIERKKLHPIEGAGIAKKSYVGTWDPACNEINANLLSKRLLSSP
jgi:hypothetical protein